MATAINPLVSRALIPKKTSISEEYTLTNHVLGLGINGKVVECFNKRSNEKCALKVLQDTPKARREVDLHYRACVCPQIVQIRDVFENMLAGKRCLLVVMECMSGGELFNRIQERADSAFNEREAAQIVRSIASAIAYLHSVNIAHRDLKVSEDLSQVKLSDFGLVKRAGFGEPDPDAGAPIYLAPELARGRSYHCPSADIFSLGIALWYLLEGTGKRHPDYAVAAAAVATPNTGTARVAAEALDCRPGRLDDAPGALWDLMVACWSDSPDARPSAADAVEALQGVLQSL